ncbi:MAG: hypothetical protein HZA08_07895 [Nitrospirae bacterium]|nr:hypothetical protein [Nitrospirota bacterium]
MKTLHILRKIEDQFVREIIEHDRSAKDVSILLIQDGVLSKFREDKNVFASVNDVEARGLDVSCNLVDYPAICRLIVGHDKVMVW